MSRQHFVHGSLVSSALALALLGLPGCGGGGGDGSSSGGGGSGGTTPPASYSIGGAISGLAGTGLVLEDNGGDALTVAGGATSFKFATALSSGSAYAVTVHTQPSNPAQTCSVSAGAGTVGSANITNVVVTCATTTYTIGGTIQGLSSAGLVLEDNGGDSLTVGANATSFTFKSSLAPKAAYDVTIASQPSSPKQYCSITNATGSVAGANVTGVAVSCHSFGQYLYVVNSTDDTNASGDVAGFRINAADGTLIPLGAAVLADSAPSAITIDPSGGYVYVANRTSADVSTFTVNLKSGALTLGQQVATRGVYNTAITLSPSGAYLFTGGSNNSSGSSLFDFGVDPLTGALTTDTNAPYDTSNTPVGLAVDPSNSFLFATAVQKHELHVFAIGSLTAANGLLTETANSPNSNLPSQPYGVVVAPGSNAQGGILFVTDEGINKVSILSYDATGTTTELTGKPWYSPYPSGVQPEGLALDSTGTCLYVANTGDGSVASFAVAVNGVLTPVQTGNNAVSTGDLNGVANPGPVDVKVDPSGPYVYVVNSLDGSISEFTTSGAMGATPCTLTLGQTYPTGINATGAALAID